MKKNLYYTTCVRRVNIIRNFILGAFHTISSYPKMVMEVFIRRNMGERYFSLATALSVGIILIITPVFLFGLTATLAHVTRSAYGYSDFTYYSTGERIGVMAWHFTTWYIFTFYYFKYTFRRYREVKRNPSVFDFGRYSLSHGCIHRFFLTFTFRGKSFDLRQIETLLEPAIFFILGIVLYFFGQYIGMLFIIASIFYSLSYRLIYREGDDFVMNIIDEQIMNEEMENDFVLGEGPENTRGVRIYSSRPTSEELARKTAEGFYYYTNEAAEMI